MIPHESLHSEVRPGKVRPGPARVGWAVRCAQPAYNRLLLSDPQAARARVDEDRDEALATSASELVQALGAFLSPADAAVLDDQMAGYLTYFDHEGLAPGSQGWWGDACAHLRARGDSSCPVSPFLF